MRPPSFDLLFHRLLEQRLELSDEDIRHLARLNRGYKGECALDECIMRHGLGHVYLQDLWIPDTDNRHPYAGCQIDSLLVGHRSLYLLETKHYSGQFHYDGLNSRLNDRPFHYDLATQLARQMHYLRSYLQSKGLPLLPITPYIIFTHPQISLTHAPSQFIYLDDFQQAIPAIKLNLIENRASNFYQQLQSTQYQNPVPPRSLTESEHHLLSPGIHCASCGQAGLTQSRYKFHCSHCGHREEKARAYLRTLYEYAILHHEQPLIRQEMVDFFGDDYKSNLISKVLSRYSITTAHGPKSQHHIHAPHLKYHHLLTHPEEKIIL